ncbi:helix-turn-helix transcriptional regulator [Iamia sp.]|uniref:helix-turn-helix domain-containing protein n=1 Tax=Iamia sp. TaxID=2722710 RepID=UPI002C858995|nr:helix-turn-helix transcriptional regulator [Iamia sp.]HXH56588.1 helix-turn-helix transcriptional regulator [Iamia sp.]
MTSEPFSAWLRRQLTRRDESQAEFARAIGKHPGVVSRWLQGKQPTPASLDLVADYFHVPHDDLLAMAGHRVEVGELAVDDPRRRLHALVDRVRWTPDLVWFMEGALERMIEGAPDDA